MDSIPGPIGSDHPRKSDRNPGFGISNGSDDQIIITPCLINVHFINTLG